MTTDWRQAIGGTIAEGFVAESLDLNEEYVLELVETAYHENVTRRFKDETIVDDRFVTIWQVVDHKTKVWQNFNLPLGYLQGKAGPNEKSNVVKFAKRFRAVPKDQPFRLVDHFQDHMRIRAYLKKQEKSDYYNIDLDTVGPFNVPARAESQDEKENVILMNTLKLYKSLDDAKEAWKVIAPGKNEAQLFLLWNRMIAERESAGAAPAPAPAQKQTGKIIEA